MLSTLRIAVRGFVRTPAFTVTALVTLALCLGANLTIFAVIESVVLRPLPFPAAEQLVTVFNSYPKAGVERDGASLPNYYDRRGAIPAFSHVSLIRHGSAIVGDAGSTERTDVVRVSPEFFATLGIIPSIGRAFTEEEMTPQMDGVAVLTDAYWRQRFNGSSNVLGRTVRVDGVNKTVVGVLPPDFRFLSSEARIFLPFSSHLSARGPGQRHSGTNADMIASGPRCCSCRRACSCWC
jgi:hypothetical protein